jgi:hypothetical protein
MWSRRTAEALTEHAPSVDSELAPNPLRIAHDRVVPGMRKIIRRWGEIPGGVPTGVERPVPLDQLQGLRFSIAYRMTGSVGDAENIVQDAFVRLERTRRAGVEVESPKAWLSAVTTRLAIDHLRSARIRRESYVGPWLPEPLLTDAAPGPLEHTEMADS